MVTRTRIISIAFIAAGVFTGLTFNDTLVILFHKLRDLYSEAFYPDIKVDNVYTPEELAQYNGEIRPLLYIAFMGTIFDVTRASKHYGKGAPYNYFVGKDGTRAFITGNFNDESENKDHVLDMTCDELLGLANWKNTIKEKYGEVGFLVGRYYDKAGKESDYHAHLMDRVGRCLVEREIHKEEERQFPPCNISWDAEEGTRVWCTKSSGGVTRDWIGVPRKMYSPGSTKPRCVCVNETKKLPTGMFQEYDNCSKTSTSCKIKRNDSP